LIESQIFVGLMSGTSLDGADAVIVDFEPSPWRLLSQASIPFGDPLKQELHTLGAPSADELARASTVAIQLAKIYASAVSEVLRRAGLNAASVRAIGCHGQTVRHDPSAGYTIQLGNAALLAELTGITVASDFRSRDIAAGGQGAPLAPAFHAAAFASSTETRCVLNLGGIANITRLPDGESLSGVTGFDTGPANCLLDLWIERHQGLPFDAGGGWALQGAVLPALLERLLSDPYFGRLPPKSTGRDYFDLKWVSTHLQGNELPVDVQATLLELTAVSITRSIERHAGDATGVIVCGGGVNNVRLMSRLTAMLAPRQVASSQHYGIDPQLVEPLAFAWLARQTLAGKPGNLPSVTGARGLRILGAIYPA